jgi:hypothetical protein
MVRLNVRVQLALTQSVESTLVDLYYKLGAAHLSADTLQGATTS